MKGHASLKVFDTNGQTLREVPLAAWYIRESEGVPEGICIALTPEEDSAVLAEIIVPADALEQMGFGKSTEEDETALLDRGYVKVI